jgi:hypothetical protein
VEDEYKPLFALPLKNCSVCNQHLDLLNKVNTPEEKHVINSNLRAHLKLSHNIK